MIELGVNQVAFSIGPVEVRWYGIFVALGVMSLVAWVLWQVKKGAKIPYDTVMTMALIGIPAGVIFARVLHVIDQWSYFSQHPSKIIGGEGLTIYGAVLGAALALWIYSRFSKIKYAYVVDVITPGIILAQMIGRVGCLLNGCCYGTATSLPWGIIYTNPHSDGYMASLALPAGMGLHPTQVYEILFLGLLFGLMMILKGKLKPDGSQFLIYLLGYSLWRFGEDFIRDGTPFLFGLHQAQVIGIIVAVISIALLVRSRVRWVKTEALPETPAS
jgi:phosphatidylglycerol---prolipoprotein diacylglyceryl transferase